MALNPVYAADGYEYQDGKRFAWILSIFVPSVLGLGPILYALTGSAAAVWIPFVGLYAVFPVLDRFIGEDGNNPPEAVVPQLEADDYYRWANYALVPVLWAVFLGNALYLGTNDLPWTVALPLTANMGLLCAFGINLGHELGHKRDKTDRRMGNLALSLVGYGHFSIDHNRGHHKHVATPEDCASSRMGESLYRFALRELPGAFFRAWGLEAARVTRLGKRVWSLENEIVVNGLVTWGMVLGFTLAFGLKMLPFFLLAFFIGAFHLTAANYIEHYGLLRQRLPDGRYEKCQPHHSWNSNHMCSNWALFHLQRHSDHHANPSRRYQSLRTFPDLPSLPSGYPGMYLLAYLPPLWFRVMNPRLMESVGGDPERIHFQPGCRDALMAKFGGAEGIVSEAAAPLS
ncbi:MAG: alkane 1-monooxygenase [Myxococcota bacterium]